MNPNTPKNQKDARTMNPRRWFQLHFFTIILLFIVASALIGLNVIPHSFRIDHTDESWIPSRNEYGWPYIFFIHIRGEGTVFTTSYLIWDASIMITLLVATTLISEIVHRRWFQLHLFTCVVLMFAASAFVFVNTRPYFLSPTLLKGFATFGDLKLPTIRQASVYGWPFPCVTHPDTIHWVFVALNALTLITLLIILAILSESLLRRPKTTPAPETPK